MITQYSRSWTRASKAFLNAYQQCPELVSMIFTWKQEKKISGSRNLNCIAHAGWGQDKLKTTGNKVGKSNNSSLDL